jgi:hypothetical protein
MSLNQHHVIQKNGYSPKKYNEDDEGLRGGEVVGGVSALRGGGGSGGPYVPVSALQWLVRNNMISAEQAHNKLHHNSYNIST